MARDESTTQPRCKKCGQQISDTGLLCAQCRFPIPSEQGYTDPYEDLQTMYDSYIETGLLHPTKGTNYLAPF